MQPTPADAAASLTTWDWAQFGLGGLVIAAMFVTLYFFVKMHREERKEWNTAQEKRDETHREERKEWQTQHKEVVGLVTGQLEGAIREVANSVKRN